MYERRQSRPLSRAAFAGRLARHLAVAMGLLGVSLGIGMVGYHCLDDDAWIDAFLAAAMILTGMGPTGEPHSLGGKLFAGFYALYSGIVFLVVIGIIVAPIAHRMLHRFHFSEKD
jgi:hypothetical protein